MWRWLDNEIYEDMTRHSEQHFGNEFGIRARARATSATTSGVVCSLDVRLHYYS